MRNAPFSLAYGEVGDALCAREALEDVLTHNRGDYAAFRDDWRSVIQTARQGDFARVMQTRGSVNLADPPEGTSWERWAWWVDDRLTELADDPTATAPLPRHPGPWQLRSGQLAETSRDVVRRALSRVSIPAGSCFRDYLVVDVGDVIGTVSLRDLEELPTRRLGVVLERTDDVRVVGLHAADPHDDPRGGSWRARWPVLASTLGGWFSEAAWGNYHPWAQQHRMLTTESDEHLDRLAAEGAELLELGDDDLHAAVRALGCYVEPSYLGLWLEWMFWRIGYFDWK